MYTVFLAGGTGSGKSTVARLLEERGCARIDLDALSREVLVAGSPVTMAIAEAFGADLVDPESQELNRAALAARAFATPQDTARLEQIELPAIRQLLEERLAALETTGDVQVCVVEIPLLDRMQDGLSRADEVLVVSCPLALRRERAIARGMSGEDFDARIAKQPSDEWLSNHADTVLANDGTADELRDKIEAWWLRNEGRGWQ